MTIPTEDARALIDELSKLSIAASSEQDAWREDAQDEMARALFDHRITLFDLAEEALLGRRARPDTGLACCWEATIECVEGCKPETETVRFDHFEALDDLIDYGHIGWGEIERIEIRLVNDERAGKLPSVREQVRS